MIQITQILTINASAFMLLMTLRIHMGSQNKGAKLLDTKIFSAMLYLTMFQCIFDTLVFWVDGMEFPLARELNYFGNIVYYILTLFISYLWPFFIEYKLNGKISKRMFLITTIPLTIITLTILLTPINGFFFTVDENNVYIRTGHNHIIHIALVAVYIMLGAILVYANPKKEGRYMFFPVACFVLPVILAMVIQALNYGISLVFMGVAIGLTGIYMSTQNDSAYIDHLCGIFNRRYYNDYIRAYCNSDKKNTGITGVLIDMDNFKPINDTLGHSVGDQALIVFSSVLRQKVRNVGFAVRYGGDEFILITEQSKETAIQLISNISAELDKINASGKYNFTLEFSYGIAEINNCNTTDEFLNSMDKHMYEMKQSKKSMKSAC